MCFRLAFIVGLKRKRKDKRGKLETELINGKS